MEKGSRGDKLMSKKRWLVIVVIVAVVVLLAILFDTMLANHRPIITSLEAEADWTTLSDSLHVTCNASDPDGDELSYNWSASGGGINGEGATVTWTAPDAVGYYNVTVTVTDGRGGEVMKQVTITVRPSMPPTIVSLTADADWTTPSGSIQVTCTAFDPEGDELSYKWSTTGGDISGTGAAINWTAPEKVGIYHVTVVVTDSHGSSATNLLPISVATEQPPTVEPLLITKDRYGHCYLLPYLGGYKVGKGQKYDIECIVSDTSGEVSYNWSWDGGELSEVSEDGSMITWTAPNTSGYITVTVIVSDIAGNMVSKSIILDVVQCSACTFGC
jgi:hypothetical protein